MNDDYIALDCASEVCRVPNIEARLRKIKEVRKRKGVNINGAKLTNHKNKW
jgi:hypothetical protein